MRPLVALLALATACGDPASLTELAGACGSCHPEQAAEHAASAHGQAATSATFLALRAEAELELRAGAFCDGCHRPRLGTETGLGCLTCHAAIGNRGTSNGRLVFDLEGPLRGPTGQVDPRAPHGAVRSDFLLSAELCGTCHEILGPGGFEERPFSRWEASPAAARGITCGDCHLGEAPGRPGPRREAPIADLPGLAPRPISTHRPIGWRSAPEELQELLRNGVALRVGEVGTSELTVSLESTNAGHLVPDGISFLRELFVTVELHWPSGARLELGPETHPELQLAARLDRGGHPEASPFRADAVRHPGLLPLEVRPLRLTFEPLGEGAPAVRACVKAGRPGEDARLEVTCAEP